MRGAKIAVAGGGMVAGYAAKRMVELGLKPGELAILSADTSVPYERPPLSKGFLAGKDTVESIRINPDDFYREHGIEVRLGTAITGLDSEHRRLRLNSGEEFAFEKLILATGANARHLDLPGAKLANVLYLRSLADSARIRDCAARAKQAAVIGGGFIGMEVAAILGQKGLAVTIILNEDRIWKRFFTPRMSQFFEDYYTARGIRFIKSATVAELRGDSAVNSVALADGSSVTCQMVVAGVGARPANEIFSGSGIELGDGVIVNEYLETSQLGIFAAGDIANYPDLVFKKRRRVEHWDNAVSQAQHCAETILAKRAPFRHVPYFFSDVFDLSYEFWGDPADAEETVHRGDLHSSSFSVWWLRTSAAVAAFAMNRPGEERDAAQSWIESGRHVSAARLGEASRPIAEAAG